MTWNKELKLKQVDELIDSLKPAQQYKKPISGWIRLIRTTLSMSARALGERIGLTQARVALIEKGEIDGTITLNTLEKVANGFGCNVVYFLVPRDGSLSKLRENQAYIKARSLDSYAELHMTLENQSTSLEYQNQEIEKIKDEYLRSWSHDFWDNI